MTNKPAKKENSLESIHKHMSTPATIGYIHGMVPASFANVLTQERIVKTVVMACKRDEKLRQCSLPSLVFAVASCCAMGLEPGGALGHAYLVPRWNSKKGELECTILVGYRGLIALARRSGDIINVEAHVVYANDDFRVLLGTQTEVVHIPDMRGKRGDVIAAHCRADFKDGGFHVEVMTREDIEHARESSIANSPAWANHYGEMAKKTVVRRASKYWPQAIDLMDAMLSEMSSDVDDAAQVVDAEPAQDNMAKARQGLATVRQSLEDASAQEATA